MLFVSIKFDKTSAWVSNSTRDGGFEFHVARNSSFGGPSGIIGVFTALSACYSRFHYSVLRFPLPIDTFFGIFIFFPKINDLMNSLSRERTPRYWEVPTNDRSRGENLNNMTNVPRNCREGGDRARPRFRFDGVRSNCVKELIGG